VKIARVSGDEAYIQTMRYFSIPGHRHRAPPYVTFEDQLRDWPREALRSICKYFGLPATSEVGVVASMLRQLRVEAENYLGNKVTITRAGISYPRLTAMYVEDIDDASLHAGIIPLGYPREWSRHSTPDPRFPQPPNHAEAVLAGNGAGICTHNLTGIHCCKYDANGVCSVGFGQARTCMVHLTTEAMEIDVSGRHDAWALRPSNSSHALHMDFTAGTKIRGSDGYFSDPRDYDRYLKHRIHAVWEASLPDGKGFDIVLLAGDEAGQSWFLEIIENLVAAIPDYPPHIYHADPDFAAARGSAELAFRWLFANGEIGVSSASGQTVPSMVGMPLRIRS